MSVNALYRTQQSEIFLSLLQYSGDSVYLEQNTLENRNVLLSSLEERTGLCFGCSLWGGAGSQGGPVQAGTPWWYRGAWPYLKHARASVEHCLAHLRGKCMQDLLQGRKRDEFSDRVASCIDLGEICGAQVSKC